MRIYSPGEKLLCFIAELVSFTTMMMIIVTIFSII